MRRLDAGCGWHVRCVGRPPSAVAADITGSLLSPGERDPPSRGESPVKPHPIAAAALLAAACSDATGPVPEPSAQPARLEAADSVLLTARRDTVTLSVEVVDTRGRRSPGGDALWSGGDPGVATITPKGLLRSVGTGVTSVRTTLGELADTVRVVVRPAGVVTLTFDDGWKSAHDLALPILSDAGLRANVGVVTGSLGWPAFLDMDQMLSLDAAGWAFVSHTVTHDSLPSLDPDALRAQIADSRRWLLESGLRAGDVFIVPYHEWGERELAEVRLHYRAARGHAHDVFSPSRFAEWRPDDPYGITSIDGLALSRTPEGRDSAVAMIERAIDRGWMADVVFHDVLPEDEPGFRALVDLLSPMRERVFTWDELFPLE